MSIRATVLPRLDEDESGLATSRRSSGDYPGDTDDINSSAERVKETEIHASRDIHNTGNNGALLGAPVMESGRAECRDDGLGGKLYGAADSKRHRRGLWDQSRDGH